MNGTVGKVKAPTVLKAPLGPALSIAATIEISAPSIAATIEKAT